MRSPSSVLWKRRISSVPYLVRLCTLSEQYRPSPRPGESSPKRRRTCSSSLSAQNSSEWSNACTRTKKAGTSHSSAPGGCSAVLLSSSSACSTGALRVNSGPVANSGAHDGSRHIQARAKRDVTRSKRTQASTTRSSSRAESSSPSASAFRTFTWTCTAVPESQAQSASVSSDVWVRQILVAAAPARWIICSMHRISSAAPSLKDSSHGGAGERISVLCVSCDAALSSIRACASSSAAMAHASTVRNAAFGSAGRIAISSPTGQRKHLRSVAVAVGDDASHRSAMASSVAPTPGFTSVSLPGLPGPAGVTSSISTPKPRSTDDSRRGRTGAQSASTSSVAVLIERHQQLAGILRRSNVGGRWGNRDKSAESEARRLQRAHHVQMTSATRPAQLIDDSGAVGKAGDAQRQHELLMRSVHMGLQELYALVTGIDPHSEAGCSLAPVKRSGEAVGEGVVALQGGVRSSLSWDDLGSTARRHLVRDSANTAADDELCCRGRPSSRSSQLTVLQQLVRDSANTAPKELSRTSADTLLGSCSAT
eukprot:scaffold41101_cov68-Phaeocystis_antarctica.AAC.4